MSDTYPMGMYRGVAGRWIGPRGTVGPRYSVISRDEPPVSGGSFVLGVDKPDASVVGPRIPESQLQNYAGTFTNTGGETVTGLAISGWADLKASNAVVRDCLINIPAAPGPDKRRGVIAWSSGVTNLVIEYTTIQPDPGVTPTVYHAVGIQGTNFTLRRSRIRRMVDGVGHHGTGFTRIEGCLIDDLWHYAFDPDQTDGAHGDGAQLMGGGGSGVVEMVGNTISAGATSAVLLQENQGAYQRVLIDRNWFDRDPRNYPGGSVVNIAGISGILTLTNNKFGRNDPAKARLIVPTTVRSASTTTISGNVYEDDGSLVASWS